MDEKLLPCPFCGNQGEFWQLRVYDQYKIKCDVCEAETGQYDSKKKALAAWNRRTPTEKGA